MTGYDRLKACSGLSIPSEFVVSKEGQWIPASAGMTTLIDRFSSD